MNLPEAMKMQEMINDGSCWKLEGAMGRAAMEALEAGDVMLGKQPVRDAYGNRVPARSEVMAGTKGSYMLVVNAHGEQWAVSLANL